MIKKFYLEENKSIVYSCKLTEEDWGCLKIKKYKKHIYSFTKISLIQNSDS